MMIKKLQHGVLPIILHGYIVSGYELLHTRSREYIVDDLPDVMNKRGMEV